MRWATRDGYDGLGSHTIINNWWHYSYSNPMSPDYNANDFEYFPDMRELKGYATPANAGTLLFGTFGNGQPATLFSSHDVSTANTNVAWMSHYGIDGIALQRFDDWEPFRNDVTYAVRNACESNHIKFFISYCDNTTTNPAQFEFSSQATNGNYGIENDWLTTMSPMAQSPAYAQENGKPVVAIQGYRPGGDPVYASNVVYWFKNLAPWKDATGKTNHGVYVDLQFLAQGFITDTTWEPVYRNANMVSDWAVGSFSGISGADWWKQNVYLPNLNWGSNNGVVYQPAIQPGSSGFNRMPAWYDNPRLHGDFMWRQYYNAKTLGITNSYETMWDEVSEGTQIIKSAEDSSMSSTKGWFQTFDADRIHVSSDYYLRLAGACSAMMKGFTPLLPTNSVPFMVGPALFQSGFETADPPPAPVAEAAAVGTDNGTGTYWLVRNGIMAESGNGGVFLQRECHRRHPGARIIMR